jgi:prophage regulatory protein
MSSYLRRSAVCERYGIARSTIYAWMNDGLFPRPVKLGPRMVAWSLEELEAWEQKRRQTFARPGAA